MVKSYTNLNWFSRRITEASTVAFSTSKSRSPRYCFLRSAQWWLCNSMGHRGAWWTHTTRGGWQATKTDGQTAWVVERCFFDAILPDPVDILVPSLKCLCSIFFRCKWSCRRCPKLRPQLVPSLPSWRRLAMLRSRCQSNYLLARSTRWLWIWSCTDPLEHKKDSKLNMESNSHPLNYFHI